MAYCEIYSSNNEQLQSLLANAALYNYWNRQYTILEAQYLEDIEPYLSQSKIKHLRDLYDRKMVSIAMYYSKPLIKTAISLKITPQYN